MLVTGIKVAKGSFLLLSTFMVLPILLVAYILWISRQSYLMKRCRTLIPNHRFSNQLWWQHDGE